MKNISILSIIFGTLVIQAISAFLAFIFVVSCIFIYGNKFLVAAFEYPTSIGLTMLMSLFAGFSGGFITMLISKKSLINPFFTGLFYLVLNFIFLYSINFSYARDHQWMLIITAILIIPVTVLGGYIYKILNNSS